MSDLEEVLDDLQAFADEESDAAIDSDGTFVLQRNGQELSGVIRQHPENGQLLVEVDGYTIPYRRYLTHNLARLDVLAQRLVERRPAVTGFIDADVTLQRAAEDVVQGKGLTVLDEQCSDISPFASRVLFITADAGHGKTALLREHQSRQAARFIAGESHYLFWHLDLQGRQLLRLSEALMGDLADLRLSGLWMPAVIRLMRRGALVVGVDGFDELAAEQGGVDALGALASLVSQLEGHGAVVAASRRTFFDTDDYLRRGGIVRRGVPDPCQFNQIELNAWTEGDVRTYFGLATFDGTAIENPVSMYDAILTVLGGDRTHPLITRPFLITQIAKASAIYGVSPEEFLHAPGDPYSGVASVVSAFVTREVTEKWKVRETGQPYLTEDQHFRFLADVAEEMHRSQKDRLQLDIVETIATLLMEEWAVDNSLRQQIIEMVRMHVLLVSPPGNQTHRSFDHPEFRDYFIAYSLRARITQVMMGEGAGDLIRVLSISQLSDSTARYVCSMLDRNPDTVATFLSAMEAALVAEWKPSYLQLNLGTLIPFMLDEVEFSSLVTFAGKVVYSSLAFEGSRVTGVTLRNGTFVNASLRDVRWKNVNLENVELGELQFDQESTFANVRLIDCKIDGVRIQASGEDETREYSPARIRRALESFGIAFIDANPPTLDLPPEVEDDSNLVRLLRKLLRMFNRTTIMSDDHLRKRFGSDFQALESELMPILIQHGVIEERKWRGSGSHRAWTLALGLDNLLSAEGKPGSPGDVWRILQSSK